MADELDVRTRRGGGDAAEGDVNAVGGGAAHDAGDQHGFLLRGRLTQCACGVLALMWSAKARTSSRMAARSVALGRR